MLEEILEQEPGQGEPRKRSLTTLTAEVEVEVNTELLEENGYHHEEDCEGGASGEIFKEGVKRLIHWHDENHDMKLWSGCTDEPCNQLSPEFRTMHW